MIVPVAVAVLIVPKFGFESVAVKVSSPSNNASSVVWTVKVCVVTP